MVNKVIALLQELIQNRCVNDGTKESGFETRSANSIKNFFKGYGIESEILEAAPGRGSILARIPGTEPGAPSLMFMGHLDVVPANLEKWSFDPFCGDLYAGYVRGRGAVDMLNITASSAVAFAEIVSKHGPFAGDLIYLGEADEEANGHLGARWLVENHWDKVKADYIVTEGGGFFINTSNGKGIALTTGEKGLAHTRLKTTGVSGHGSLPYMADNALIKISRIVEQIRNYKSEILLTKEYKDMVNAMNINGFLRFMLLTPYLVPFALKSLYKQIPGLAKQLHAASRMTISPDKFQAGTKINIIPDAGTLDVDIRILPGQTIEDVIQTIHKILGPMDNQVSIEILDFFPANSSSVKTPFVDATVEIIGTVFPGIPFVPTLFSGVTDARFWRMRGSNVYGFTQFDENMTFTEYAAMLHGNDERVSVKSLELSVNYFYRLPETFFRIIGAG